MGIINTLKEVVFAETDDPGKVCQIVWNDDKTSGVAMLLVPHAAYKRFTVRACLRALRIKLPNAQKIVTIKKEHSTVKYPTIHYQLVRVEFKTK